MKTLDRKLWRELWSLRSQVLAIAMVIASGVATYVMTRTTVAALQRTQAQFYRDYRFGDVFASLKRAPDELARRLAAIPGVARVETRVQAPVRLEVAGFNQPISGLLVSIPDHGQPALNRLYLRRGRLPDPTHANEAAVSEAFAEAQGLQPGSHLTAVINGRRQRLLIVGIALSPEFIYQIQPGAMFPDYKRYGILWLNRTPLATAYDLDGAFNDVVLSLFPGARESTVLDRVDALLARYGGLGAYGRVDQLSHRYLDSELRTLVQMAVILPLIFLGVAAFLLNVVIRRLVSLQREQIAILKAFGYSNRETALHYLELVLLIVALGALLGVIAGGWLGSGLAHLYQQFFRFPFLDYVLQPRVVAEAVLISVLAGVLGALQALRRVARLPPAEAMRPEAPARYHRSVIEWFGVGRLLAAPSRMILRNLQRQPLKALLSITGIALSCAILVLGMFQEDAVSHMITVEFGLSQRADVSVALTNPVSDRAWYELKRLPGVRYVEPFRTVPVRLRHAQHSYRTALQGLPPASRLRRLLDTELKVIRLPPSGVVLTDYLARLLDVHPGERITVEVLEGRREIRQVTVAAVVSQYVGVAAYMDRAGLNRLLGSGPALNGAYLQLDPGALQQVYSELQARPRVAGVTIRANAIRSFEDTMGQNLLVFAFINTLLAGSIAFGVIYNNARINLSERSRELASLRVLGFSRGEVGYILLGELTVLTVLAIPPGFVLGRALCAYLAHSMEFDLYRVPVITEPSTFAFAASVVLAATLLSGLVVWWRLGRLDLVAVLKTRE